MALGISPINNFAFAKTFARPENKVALISLLNAILQLEFPVDDVTILNPFNYQDFADDKLTILDLKATDTRGRLFNVEMQLASHQGLLQRIVYYGCEVYTDQLRKGDDYSMLRPVFAICLLRGTLWRDNPKVHHRFLLTDSDSGRALSETLEIHTLELGWYNVSTEQLASASSVDRWLFWLLYDEQQLRALFPELEFQVATESLLEIKGKTEDKAMYDAQEKARRDYEWAMNSSRREGKIEGKVEGEIKGEIKLIRTLQSILSEEPTSELELGNRSLDDLQKLTAQLQARIQDRPQA